MVTVWITFVLSYPASMRPQYLIHCFNEFRRGRARAHTRKETRFHSLPWKLVWNGPKWGYQKLMFSEKKCICWRLRVRDIELSFLLGDLANVSFHWLKSWWERETDQFYSFVLPFSPKIDWSIRSGELECQRESKTEIVSYIDIVQTKYRYYVFSRTVFLRYSRSRSSCKNS